MGNGQVGNGHGLDPIIRVRHELLSGLCTWKTATWETAILETATWDTATYETAIWETATWETARWTCTVQIAKLKKISK